MKKISPCLCRLLFAMVALYPVGTALCACFGYRFRLNSALVFSAATALLALIVVLFCEVSVEHSVDAVLMAILLPMSLLSALFYIIADKSVVAVVGAIVTAVFCLILTIENGKPFALKVVALVLSALLALPVGLFGFFTIVVGNFGENTVVTTVESPDGKYYAEVIDSDQGALGGDTLVDVYEAEKCNAILFTIEKKPQRVYFGEWGEFRDMEIYWKDDRCLVINSVDYEIK
ncbi:MAG: hypothetical protein E7464_03880 [Ruminococcaceae bacterium]|nr:hypothetical protein [Oscillospiraceae bacterium]